MIQNETSKYNNYINRDNKLALSHCYTKLICKLSVFNLIFIYSYIKKTHETCLYLVPEIVIGR